MLTMNLSERCLFLAFDERYSLPGSVALRTALRFAPADIGAVVASVGLSTDSQHRIRAIGQEAGRPVSVVDASHLVDGLPNGLARFSAAAWARVFLEDIVPPGISRVVYVDADTYCRRPIDELFDLELNGLPLGAVPDAWEPTHHLRGTAFWKAAKSPPFAGYFNSGVMVVDVGAWRESGVRQRTIDVIEAGDVPTRSVDQDALNAVLWSEWLPLDSRWNTHGAAIGLDPSDATIVHFVGDEKPWNSETLVSDFMTEYLAEAQSVGWHIQPTATQLN